MLSRYCPTWNELQDAVQAARRGLVRQQGEASRDLRTETSPGRKVPITVTVETSNCSAVRKNSSAE